VVEFPVKNYCLSLARHCLTGTFPHVTCTHTCMQLQTDKTFVWLTHWQCFSCVEEWPENHLCSYPCQLVCLQTCCLLPWKNCIQQAHDSPARPWSMPMQSGLRLSSMVLSPIISMWILLCPRMMTLNVSLDSTQLLTTLSCTLSVNKLILNKHTLLAIRWQRPSVLWQTQDVHPNRLLHCNCPVLAGDINRTINVFVPDVSKLKSMPTCLHPPRIQTPDQCHWNPACLPG